MITIQFHNSKTGFNRSSLRIFFIESPRNSHGLYTTIINNKMQFKVTLPMLLKSGRLSSSHSFEVISIR